MCNFFREQTIHTYSYFKIVVYSALLGGEVVRVERVKGLDITCGAATTRYFVCDDDGRYEAQ